MATERMREFITLVVPVSSILPTLTVFNDAGYSEYVPETTVPPFKLEVNIPLTPL
jgi:hypothetical protein